VTIPEADHWLHVTAPDALERTLSDFLSNAAIPVRDPRH
jgi:pimeloyl-ACP methyl ester carboxylesterase